MSTTNSPSPGHSAKCPSCGKPLASSAATCVDCAFRSPELASPSSTPGDRNNSTSSMGRALGVAAILLMTPVAMAVAFFITCLGSGMMIENLDVDGDTQLTTMFGAGFVGAFAILGVGIYLLLTVLRTRR